MPGPEQVPVTVVPRGTVGFERKVQVRDYETATASIFIGFDIDPSNEAATVQAAKDAFFQAQSVVLEQLGVTFEYDEQKGIVKELLTAKFGPVTEVSSVQTAAPSSNGNIVGGGQKCPKCNSDMYDNRNSKTNPRQPDFRCKQYKAADPCDGVVWPPKGR